MLLDLYIMCYCHTMLLDLLIMYCYVATVQPHYVAGLVDNVLLCCYSTLTMLLDLLIMYWYVATVLSHYVTGLVDNVLLCCYSTVTLLLDLLTLASPFLQTYKDNSIIHDLLEDVLQETQCCELILIIATIIVRIQNRWCVINLAPPSWLMVYYYNGMHCMH